MVQATDPMESADRSVAAFYDALAPDYDAMTGFEKRFVHERPFFRLLVQRFAIGRALDAGSGTGFHSLLLAKLGVAVTSVDISRSMLERLQIHAKEMDVNLQVVESTFHDLPEKLNKEYDAVFCMGNTLAHLLSAEELRHTLDSFRTILKAQGILFLQNLNYDRILVLRERVQSVKEQEGTTFVRFYDYESKLIRFNILKLKRTESGFVHRLDSVDLRPVMKDELTALLRDAGFGRLEFFGGVSMEEFRPDVSRDLVVLATQG